MSRAPRFRFVVLTLFAFALVTPWAMAANARPLIAIMGATPAEVAALHKEFGVGPGGKGFTSTTLLGMRFDRGVVDGRDIIIFQAGLSVVNAAYQLQLALDRFPITHVLFAGIAGGIDPALHVGDIVIPERWAYHDTATYLNEDGKGGYVQTGRFATPEYENFGMIFPRSVRVVREGEEQARPMPFFPADRAMLDAARRALPKLPQLTHQGRNVSVSVGGVGLSGSVFVQNVRYREYAFKVWQARALDKESTAYAHVCWANSIPVLIIRGLSDLAGGEPGKQIPSANEYQEVYGNGATVLHAVLNELPR